MKTKKNEIAQNLLRTMLPLLTVCLLGGVHKAQAQVEVEINVNAQHSVGGISTFDREKFVTIHSSLTEGDWTDDQDKMDEVMNDYDVYFGRDTGYITWWRNSMITQEGTTGWASESSVATQGSSSRGSYELDTWRHAYESRAQSDIMCAQWHPFYPDGTTGNGWAFSQTDTTAEPFGSATGHFMGHFLNEFYDSASYSTGRPLPPYVEVINEPDWELWGWNPPSSTALPDQLFKFHNSVADQIHSINSEVLVGGHCTAFPDFENGDFDEWNKEWKNYIDTCGANMDFHTIHFYDFNESAPITRRGSNMEAGLDMIEHYSDIVLGDPLPFVISEFGGRNRSLEGSAWSASRDWYSLKSMSSMMMSFMDRPDLMLKVIPFIMVKADWYGSNPAYPWRLMRNTNEPTDFTGDWVYTEMVNLYKLWSNVNGTRVDVISDDPDVQIDAYVDGNKAYVILNNLNTASATVNLNLFGNDGNAVQSVFEKNMYWGGSAVALDETTHTGDISSVTLGSEGTAILEYTFASSVTVDETSDEAKYYATTYLQPISTGVANTFSINGVTKSTAYGEAVLRLGMGRLSAASKQPTVLVNGTAVTVPTDFMGHEGDSRSRFFGVLDIPVPYDLLQANNTISVTYSDNGGYISSVSLRVFEFSADLRGTGVVPVDVTDVSVSPTTSEIKEGETVQLTATIAPADASNQVIYWSSLSPSVASVDSSGLVSGLNAGTALIVVETDDGGFKATNTVTVTDNPVTGVSVSPTTGIITPTTSYQLTANVVPADAADTSVSWTSLNPSVATVDSSGLVSGVANGTAQIVVTTTDGGLTATNTTTVSDGTGGTSITVEAEDFADTGGTEFNEDGSSTGANIYSGGTGQAINWIQVGDWMEYSVDVAEAGTYKVEYYISTPLDGSTIEFQLGGVSQMTDAVPNNGGWDTFEALESSTVVSLSAGINTITLVAGSNAWQWNMDYFVLTRIDGGDPIVVTGVSVSPTTSSIDEGATAQLTATIVPGNASTQSVTWASLNPSVATVDASGLVSGVTAGTASIVVTTVDGGFKATNTTTVTALPILVDGVSVSPETSGIDEGANVQLTATVSPANADNTSVTWSSLSPSVATVNSSGLVSGLTAGTAEIVVTTVDGGFKATNVTTVTALPIDVDGVSVSPETSSIQEGASVQLTATVSPANADDTSVTWSSLNPSVATVNASGLVSGLTAGTAEIVVTTVDGGFKATNTTTVTTIPPVTDGPVLEISIVDGEVVINMTNGTADAYFKVLASEDLTDENGWSIIASNLMFDAVGDAIVSNSVGTAGEVFFKVEEGESTVITPPIPVTDVSVAPTTDSVAEGATIQLTETVLPANAGNKAVTWSSLNPGIATVNSSGLVTGIAEGTATIRVTTADGGFTADSTITVTSALPTSLTIEAESYDSTGGSGTYVNYSAYGGDDAVGVMSYTTGGGVDAINFVQLDDYAEYLDIEVAAGVYQVEYFTGTTVADTQISLQVDGTTVASDSVVNNNDWDTFVSLVSGTQVEITTGTHTLRVVGTGATEWQWNLDRFILTRVGDLP